jgi:CheY-like chemotaxis protein
MATVLIVEDEAVVLILAEAVVQDAGHDTLTATSVVEATSIIESDQAFDIVFTDVGLRDEWDGGLQIGILLRNRRPNVPVLYTSGQEMTDRLRSLLVERSAFLPKPYTDVQATEALARLLEEGRSPSNAQSAATSVIASHSRS